MDVTLMGADRQKDNPCIHYTLFVPLTQNDGSHQPAERLDWVEGELVKRAGGLTRYSPGQGLWVSPMARPLCRDRILPVHLVMPTDPQAEVWLVALVAEIALRFEQDEIFVFAQPVWLLTR